MKTNEQIFNEVCSQRMLQFNLEQFKQDNPSLYNAIIIAMNQAKSQTKKPIKEEQWR